MPADDHLGPRYRHVFAQLPAVQLLDAHTHVGEHDPDGFRCSPEELIAALERVDSRAVVFPMHEPDGDRAANDWVIATAFATAGRLTPFCRVNPLDGGRRELERCLRAGAKGLKLHPRAEEFSMAEPRSVSSSRQRQRPAHRCSSTLGGAFRRSATTRWPWLPTSPRRP